MTLEKVIFGFFVMLAATLNFGGNTQLGAVQLAASLVALLQLAVASGLWVWAAQVSAQGLDGHATASVVSLSGGALLANLVYVTLLVIETATFRRRQPVGSVNVEPDAQPDAQPAETVSALDPPNGGGAAPLYRHSEYGADHRGDLLDHAATASAPDRRGHHIQLLRGRDDADAGLGRRGQPVPAEHFRCQLSDDDHVDR